MAGHDDFGVQFGRASHGGIEVVELEPHEDAIAAREVRIADRAVMMLDVPAVQLQDQNAAGCIQAFVFWAAVGTLAAK